MTPEDEQLHEAIRAKVASLESGGILTDWITIAAEQNFDEDGDGITRVATFIADGSLPMYRIIGLLEYALTRYRALVATAEVED